MPITMMILLVNLLFIGLLLPWAFPGQSLRWLQRARYWTRQALAQWRSHFAYQQVAQQFRVVARQEKFSKYDIEAILKKQRPQLLRYFMQMHYRERGGGS